MYGIAIFLIYAAFAVIIGIFAAHYSYFPILIGAILTFTIVVAKELNGLKLVKSYGALCLIIMASQVVCGIAAGGYPHLFDNFLESQFWLAVYFYVPLLFICPVIYLLIANYQKNKTV
jgi:hypothetical protein